MDMTICSSVYGIINLYKLEQVNWFDWSYLQILKKENGLIIPVCDAFQFVMCFVQKKEKSVLDKIKQCKVDSLFFLFFDLTGIHSFNMECQIYLDENLFLTFKKKEISISKKH